MKSKKVLDPDLANIMPLLIGTWRRLRKEAGPSEVLQTREFRSVVASVKSLQEGLDSKNLVGVDYFANQDMLSAYILYQWVLHYQQGLSLIGELPVKPGRVLDICSGPGAFAFAALKQGAREVFATDQNNAALQLGAEICGRYGLPVNIRQWNCRKSQLPIEGKFDLIILGHCLEELFPSSAKQWSEHQHQFITYLLSKLNPNGYLLIVENSFIEANRRVLQLRDQLVLEGIPVQAPCVWKGSCPALQVKDSPCYAQREFEKPKLIKEIQRAAGINLGSLKMSYMIFRSPQAQWPQLPQKDYYRIISPPVETFQGKRFYLCGTDGKKNLGSHLSEHPPESRSFEYLRRGELISVEDALVSHNALDIVQDTKVKIEAACGKPIPMLEQDTDY
jgi:SAM-dependent methyltransferase